MKRLFKQFSFPGGIPSHVAPETPGSIHEGGELGYACHMHMVRCLTTRISLWLVSSVMVKPKPVRLRQAGIPTSFSIRCMTARCCRSCI